MTARCPKIGREQALRWSAMIEGQESDERCCTQSPSKQADSGRAGKVGL